MQKQYCFIFAPVLASSWLFYGPSCISQSLSLSPMELFRQNPLVSEFHSELPAAGISLSERWDVLGPFRLGTRGMHAEAIWGADPLERYGGFHHLQKDPETSFNSALPTNGTVKWMAAYSTVSSSSYSQTEALLKVSFPNVDWDTLHSVYGWSALQYQSWARGTLEITGSQPKTIALFGGGLLEFSVDGKRHFGGDLYQYNRAPSILRLNPGPHALDLRLTRDVRALGGLTNTVEAVIRAELRDDEDLLTVDHNSLLVSELAEGRLGSPWASISVQNNGAETIEIISLSGLKDASQLFLKAPLKLYAYQTRPLIFRISPRKPSDPHISASIVFSVGQKKIYSRPFNISFEDMPLSGPLRFTYLHPSSIVSYAIMRPPPLDICKMDYALPVIVVFHGAGLQANSPQAREMLDAAYGVCAWMLFPSGVTSWSGDDWHYWGIADLQAALLAIPDWIANVDWRGPTSSQEDLIVVGHSNGGQGAWYFSTHFPDKVSGVAPVAAYTSIENYVPYTMWQFSDPSLSSVLSRSRSSYRHELLLSNLAGIPIAQQHGSCDNNVPVYHARLMHELLDQIQWPSMYQELPGKPHWFEGVMTTQYLRDFYHVMINKTRKTLEDQLPETFTITIPASGDLGSKAKIQVDQLQSPDTNGKLKVSRASGTHTWYITTWNIYRFHLSSEGPRIELPLFIVLDNTQIAFDVDPSQLLETWYLKDANGQWSVSHDSHWRTLDQRYGRQLGAMDAILHTRGPFTIRMCSPGIEHAALQVSRNLLQYFAADSQIVEGCLDDWERSQPGSNTITLAMGQDLPPALLDSYPIRIERDRLVIWKNHSVLARSVRRHEFSWEAGLGAVFLRPREDEALELVIWGADLAGLSQSLRLAPTITGSGQPDYVVLSDHCRWQGIAGVYAAGHLDRSWQVSPASYHSQPI